MVTKKKLRTRKGGMWWNKSASLYKHKKDIYKESMAFIRSLKNGLDKSSFYYECCVIACDKALFYCNRSFMYESSNKTNNKLNIDITELDKMKKDVFPIIVLICSTCNKKQHLHFSEKNSKKFIGLFNFMDNNFVQLLRKEVIDSNTTELNKYTESFLLKVQPNSNESRMNAQPNSNESRMNAQPNLNEARMNAQPNLNESRMNAQPNSNKARMNAQPNSNQARMNAQPNSNQARMNAQPNSNESQPNLHPNSNKARMNAHPNSNQARMNAQPNSNESQPNLHPNSNKTRTNLQYNLNKKNTRKLLKPKGTPSRTRYTTHNPSGNMTYKNGNKIHVRNPNGSIRFPVSL